jgi:AcrR family transcriptional regulator
LLRERLHGIINRPVGLLINTMKKGQATRQRIIEAAAALFNQRGYEAASISDVMEATGLQKGGIYGHFASKEQLALEAFDYAVRLIADRMTAEAATHSAAPERLVAFVHGFASLMSAPPIPGGCALFNAAVESADGDPALRAAVRDALAEWQASIRDTVRAGIGRGELKPDADPDEAATLLIALLEGALVLSRVEADPQHLQRAVDHAVGYIQRDLSLEHDLA